MGHFPWKELRPDVDNTWFVPEHKDEFSSFAPLGDKTAKFGDPSGTRAVFALFTMGVKTNRDNVVYDFSRNALQDRVKQFVDDYNGEVDRFKRAGNDVKVDDFVNYERIKWSRDLKKDLQRGRYAVFSKTKIRSSLYRPFCRRWLFFDPILNQDIVRWPTFLPTGAKERENVCITTTDLAFRAPQFSTLVSSQIVDLHLCASLDGHQSFPFYVYDRDGSNRRENVTDWALKHFRKHYGDKKITKWDIFYYVYGLLHHPGYRERFAENLKRELPRVPMAPDFRAFARAGRELAKLHLEYEKLQPHALDWIETPDVPLSYRVEKMKLSKDKTQLKVNHSLSLGGIPPEVFGYRLGNRSALDWVIDQYRIKTDKRSGITSDPNRTDDPEYIVRLVGQVVHVSLETVRIVAALPDDFAAKSN